MIFEIMVNVCRRKFSMRIKEIFRGMIWTQAHNCYLTWKLNENGLQNCSFVVDLRCYCVCGALWNGYNVLHLYNLFVYLHFVICILIFLFSLCLLEKLKNLFNNRKCDYKKERKKEENSETECRVWYVCT